MALNEGALKLATPQYFRRRLVKDLASLFSKENIPDEYPSRNHLPEWNLLNANLCILTKERIGTCSISAIQIIE